MKRAIFTFYNLSLDTDIVRLQAEVVKKFNTTADFHPLCSQTHGEEVIHPDAVDYGFNQLFVEEKYDTVLLLDVDCIPLNSYALEYTFEHYLLVCPSLPERKYTPVHRYSMVRNQYLR